MPTWLDIQIIAELPERGWTGGAVLVIVFVEPCPQDAASRLNPTNLNTLTSPAFFAVVDGERRPAN
jgi:hypothetical protein